MLKERNKTLSFLWDISTQANKFGSQRKTTKNYYGTSHLEMVLA